jgi:hypothetical protein
MLTKWLFRVSYSILSVLVFHSLFDLFSSFLFLAVLPKPKNTISMNDEDRPSPSIPATTSLSVSTGGSGAGSSNAMKFSLLSRDNKGRLEARQLLVPKENPMAVKLAKAEEAAKMEKMKIKERTLALNSMNAEVEERMSLFFLATNSYSVLLLFSSSSSFFFSLFSTKELMIIIVNFTIFPLVLFPCLPLEKQLFFPLAPPLWVRPPRPPVE